MKNWFTVEAVDGETYVISEYTHWEQPHCYLLLGKERAALIDTGLGVGSIGGVVKKITSLPVTVLLTHAHWDHIGGLWEFPEFMQHGAEEKWLSEKFPLPLEEVKAQLLKKPCDFPDSFDSATYRIFRGMPRRLLKDGEVIELGGRRLEILHTPGHSPGHLCFFERERGYLFSGDLLYKGCLDAFYPTTDPRAFFCSVKRICSLGAGRILPGHYGLDIPSDFADRVSDAFFSIEQKGLLSHGNGMFDFGDFSVKV